MVPAVPAPGQPWPGKIRCVVAAQSGIGPVLFFCTVECLEAACVLGRHYAKAEGLAEDADYERPFVVFDENDGPHWLFDHFPKDTNAADTDRNEATVAGVAQ